jgi:hypothetical protein
MPSALSPTRAPSSSIQGALPLGAVARSTGAERLGRPAIKRKHSSFLQDGLGLGRPNSGPNWCSVIMRVSLRCPAEAFFLAEPC